MPVLELALSVVCVVLDFGIGHKGLAQPLEKQIARLVIVTSMLCLLNKAALAHKASYALQYMSQLFAACANYHKIQPDIAANPGKYT